MCWVALSNNGTPSWMQQQASSSMHYCSWLVQLCVISRYFTLSLCLTSSCQFRPLLYSFLPLLHSWLATCCESEVNFNPMFGNINPRPDPFLSDAVSFPCVTIPSTYHELKTSTQCSVHWHVRLYSWIILECDKYGRCTLIEDLVLHHHPFKCFQRVFCS